MAQTAVSRIQSGSAMGPCHHPAAMVSTTVAPAMMAVRRSSAAVAAINGATMNSEITIRPDVAASTQGKSSHKTAIAIAACSACGRDRVFTPALVDLSFMASPSASPGSPPGPAMLRHSLPAVLLARTPPLARSGFPASASTGREDKVPWTLTRS